MDGWMELHERDVQAWEHYDFLKAFGVHTGGTDSSHPHPCIEPHVMCTLGIPAPRRQGQEVSWGSLAIPVYCQDAS